MQVTSQFESTTVLTKAPLTSPLAGLTSLFSTDHTAPTSVQVVTSSAVSNAATDTTWTVVLAEHVTAHAHGVTLRPPTVPDAPLNSYWVTRVIRLAQTPTGTTPMSMT
jgi:hypothetical protein